MNKRPRISDAVLPLALLLAGCLLLSGCAQAEAPATVGSDNRQIPIIGWDDPTTGCKYFYNRSYGGNYIVTPRFWSNGQPMCPGNKP